MMNIAFSIISILLSGVIANIISNLHNRRYQDKQTKFKLLDDIFGYRYQLSDGFMGSKAEIIRALNRIPIVFSDCDDVIMSYNEFYKTATTTANGKVKDDQLVTLLKKMCISVGIDTSNWNDSYINNVFLVK